MNEKYEGMVFIPNNTKVNNKSYQYGFFYQESDSKYYLTDDIIKNIVSKIDWKLNEIEEAFLKKWREFEHIHRDFCLGKISEKKYKKEIEEGYSEFYNINRIDFGEGCDELQNFLMRNLIG